MWPSESAFSSPLLSACFCCQSHCHYWNPQTSGVLGEKIMSVLWKKTCVRQWLKITHISGLFLTVLCLSSAEINRDWSDHMLWWEQKQRWLLRTSWTLEKYGIHADARLLFMPQHKPLKLRLPSGITLRLRACFSSPVFKTVMGICQMLSESQPLMFPYSCLLLSSFVVFSCLLLVELHIWKLNMFLGVKSSD